MQRILEAHQLAPHRIRTFKLSTDPKFAEKLKDVVGLYVDPPAHAVVLSVDEKSQIQALDRTQPGLPMKPGHAGTMTHDYKRHGTTTLFAALNILEGTVIGRNMQHHRHQEFIRFLNTIEEQVPVGKVIHAIVDNYATHKHPKVRQWLARHPRWTFHFTPTSASWLNAVEGFFAKLTRQRLKRGVFRSVTDLRVAINRFVADTNVDPKPFVWTADPKRVLAAVKRGEQTLESVHQSLPVYDLTISLADCGTRLAAASGTPGIGANKLEKAELAMVRENHSGTPGKGVQEWRCRLSPAPRESDHTETEAAIGAPADDRFYAVEPSKRTRPRRRPTGVGRPLLFKIKHNQHLWHGFNSRPYFF